MDDTQKAPEEEVVPTDAVHPTTAPAPAGNNVDYLCFDPEEFENEDDFSAAAFLVEKRRYVPIDTLVRDLTSYRDTLQEEVVHLVNTEVYDTFLTVTNKLYQREEDLLRLQAPLQDIASRVGNAHSKLEASKDKVEDKLLKIQHLEREKSFALQKLKIIVTEHKMKAALKLFHAPETTAAVRVATLTSIVSYAKQLEVDERFLLPIQESHKQEKLHLCARISQLRVHVHTTLDTECSGFLQKYRAGEESEELLERIRVCFECYHELEREAACYEVFKQHIGDPSAEETVSWSAASASRENTEALVALFAQPIELCTTKWRRITEIADSAGIEYMVTALWLSFSDTFSKRLHYLFDSGNPLLFSKRYRAAHSFAQALESICSTHKALLHLRKEMKLWENRWNVEVYFKMCEINVTHQFAKWCGKNEAEAKPAAGEATTTKGKDEIAFTCAEDFAFTPCCAAFNVLHWIASEEVMIFALSHRFITLSMGMMDKLKEWHTSFIAAKDLPTIEDGVLSLPAEGAAGKDDVDVLVKLYLDLPVLKSKLRESFAPSLLAFYEGNPDMCANVNIIVDAILGSCSQIAIELSHALSSLVASKCLVLASKLMKTTGSNITIKQSGPDPDVIKRGLEPFTDFIAVLEQNSCPAETIQGMRCYQYHQFHHNTTGWSSEVGTVILTQFKYIAENEYLRYKNKSSSLNKFNNNEGAKGGQRLSPPALENMTNLDKFSLKTFELARSLSAGLKESGVQVDTMVANQVCNAHIHPRLRGRYITSSNTSTPALWCDSMFLVASMVDPVGRSFCKTSESRTTLSVLYCERLLIRRRSTVGGFTFISAFSFFGKRCRTYDRMGGSTVHRSRTKVRCDERALLRRTII